jgi:hypothetical protein
MSFLFCLRFVLLGGFFIAGCDTLIYDGAEEGGFAELLFTTLACSILLYFLLPLLKQLIQYLNNYE